MKRKQKKIFGQAKQMAVVAVTVLSMSGATVLPAFAAPIYSGQTPAGAEGSKAVSAPGAAGGSNAVSASGAAGSANAAASSDAAGNSWAVGEPGSTGADSTGTYNNGTNNTSTNSDTYATDYYWPGAAELPDQTPAVPLPSFPKTELTWYTIPDSHLLKLTQNAILFSLPQEDAPPVEALAAETLLYLTDDTLDGWYQVKYDGNNAYISKNSGAKLVDGIEMQPGMVNRAMVVGYAFQYLGGKYTYGGRSVADGFDCSGFVKMVLANTMGIQMGSNTKAQVKQGTPVDATQLQPGDLIFFGESEDTVYHVEMYIGNNLAIHSSSSGRGVVVDPCYNSADIFRIISVIPGL